MIDGHLFVACEAYRFTVRGHLGLLPAEGK